PRVHEITEVERGAPMRLGGYHDDARRCGLPEPPEEQIREQEGRKVVHREGEVVSVGAPRARGAYDSRVVVQHVEARLARLALLRQAAKLRELGEVGPDTAHVAVAG